MTILCYTKINSHYVAENVGNETLDLVGIYFHAYKLRYSLTEYNDYPASKSNFSLIIRKLYYFYINYKL